MRQFASALILLVLIGFLVGCGDGSSAPATKPVATVTLSVALTSLNKGAVTSASAAAQDASNSPLANQTFTFSSSNSSLVSASPNGAICAGTWDSVFIVCTPAADVGTAQLTATAGGVTSAAVTVYVHERLDKIRIASATTAPCLSQNQTSQFTAQAFSGTTDITPTVGPIGWSSTDSDVASIDAAGLATAKIPGQTNIFATGGNVNSQTVSFETCRINIISHHLAGSADTSITLASAATQQLNADLADTQGVLLSGVPITWTSSQPAVASVNSSGLVTAGGAGVAQILASCTPPSCNKNLFPAYGNFVTVTVPGTTSTTVYVAGTSSTSLVPVDSTTNTPGSAITLPAAPTSLVFNSQGSRVFIGTASSVLILDTSNNAITPIMGVNGNVLAVSPTGNRVLTANASNVFVLNVESNQAATLNLANATRAAFSPDGYKAYILAGATLGIYNVPAGTFRTVSLAAAATDVDFLAAGPVAYLVGGSASAVTVRATCNDDLLDTVTTTAVPGPIKSLPNGTKVLAADSPGLDIINVSGTTTQCPASVTDALTTVDFGAGAFTPSQLLVAPDSSRAFVLTTDRDLVVLYDLTMNKAFLISLVGGPTATTAGITLDGTTAFVGGSDSMLHRIDLTVAGDVKQIQLSFRPDFVAVRPK